MSIPEKASMAPKRNTEQEMRDLRFERAVLALESITKNLNYINQNIFEVTKALGNLERSLDSISSKVGGI